MVNSNVERVLEDCKNEMMRIKVVADRDTLGSTNQYLTKYCLIKACGTIEQAFKSLIYDFIENIGSALVSNYVYKMVKKSSMNPSFGNMVNLLNQFNENWGGIFKGKVNGETESSRIKESLESLNSARNQFAHGGNPTISLDSIITYFNDACIILQHYEATIEEHEE